MPKAKKRRYVYAEHSEEQILDAIRIAIPEGGRLWDWFSQIAMDSIDGQSEWERGKQEGRRELAGEVLTMAMMDATENKVRKNVE